MFFDVVIPLGPNDYHKIYRQVEATRKNVIGLKNIYVITSSETPLRPIEGVLVLDENEFPFHMEDIARRLSPSKRNGWYFQQLLKMYAGIVIPNLTGEPMDRYLIIDADTVFLRPVSFVDAEDRCLYNWSGEDEGQYFDHMKRLHPEFGRTVPGKSGICHHMMIETAIMQELMKKVERHADNGKIFWEIFLEKVDHVHYEGSGASEYEIYFHYVFRFHPESVALRGLHWVNKHGNFKIENADRSLDYVSTHWWVSPPAIERPFVNSSRLTRRLRH
jgi:hypothetical protein